MPRRAQRAAAAASSSNSNSRMYSRPPQGPPPGPRPNSNSSNSSSRPAARPPTGPPTSAPPSSNYYKVPAGPPPSKHNTHSSSSSSSSLSSGPRPPEGRPPRTYYETLEDGSYRANQQYSSGRPSGHNQYATMPAATGTIPDRTQPRPDKHLRYPPNYYCPKCGNTGIKIKKGTPCTDCYRQFGVPNRVQTIPSNFAPAFAAPPRVLPPGHPGIGGRLCGRCRGSGLVSEMLLFESTCPICHGVGRVF